MNCQPCFNAGYGMPKSCICILYPLRHLVPWSSKGHRTALGRSLGPFTNAFDTGGLEPNNDFVKKNTNLASDRLTPNF